MRTGQMLECKFQMWKEMNKEGEKLVKSVWDVDFEVPKGHSGSGVQQTVGKQSVKLRRPNSLQMQIWESPVFRER